MAGSTTQFLGHVPSQDLPSLFARARALLFPGLEDFGIVPVEAQAAGLPVVAYGVGGVRDSVIDGRTGILYGDGSVAGLCEAILRFESTSFDDRDLRANAAQFGPVRFAAAFAELLGNLNPGARMADTLRTL